METELSCAWNAVKECAAHNDSAAWMESARPRAICGFEKSRVARASPRVPL